MRRVTLYTMGGWPVDQQRAIRQLIAQERGIDPELWAISNANDFGRVYYGAIDRETKQGLVFLISRWDPQYGPRVRTTETSEWEVKDLKKYARYLDIENFTVLPAVRLFEDEIQSLSLTPTTNTTNQ